MELDVRPDGLAHRRNDGFASSRRRVTVAATRRAEPDLERLAADLVAKRASRAASSAGRDVAAHARSVGRQRPHGAAEEDRHGFAGDLPVEVPERGVDACQRAAEERPGELQLRVDHGVVDRVDLADVPADDQPRDQPMQDLGGDVGLVGRNLSPPGLPVARRDAHERERLAPERLDRLHGEAARHDGPIAVARRAAQVVVAAGAGRRLRLGTGVRQRGCGRGQGGTTDDLLEEAAACACASHGALSWKSWSLSAELRRRARRIDPGRASGRRRNETGSSASRPARRGSSSLAEDLASRGVEARTILSPICVRETRCRSALEWRRRYSSSPGAGSAIQLLPGNAAARLLEERGYAADDSACHLLADGPNSAAAGTQPAMKAAR